MIQSFKVAATLAANRIVAAVTGTANTVQYAVSTTNAMVGVTVDTVKDTTMGIPVAGPGEIAQVYFNDTVASGELVGSDTSGRGIPYTAVTGGTWHIGILVGPSVAATGTIADVYILPGLASSEA